MKRLFNNRKINLATLLTCFVSASVILTILILLVSSYHSEKVSLINTYLSLNYSKSNKISSSVDSLFGSMRMSLEDTAHFLGSKDGMTDEEIQEQLELLRNSSRYFNSITWIDETGLIRNIAPLSTGLKGQVIATGETKKVLNAKKPALTSPYIGPSGRLLVLMSQPLYDKNGTYKGMIGGSIYLQEKNVLNEILGNDAVDESGSYYYVVGPEGVLLFHPDQKRIGEEATANPVIRKLMQGESGMERVINTKGIPMLAAYSFVPKTGWGVVQQTPFSFVHDLLLNHIQKLILTVLPPFILLLFLAIFIARKLAAPFIHLADLVNQLGSGKALPVPRSPSHWNREADLLTKSVIIAIEAVGKSNDQLTHAAITDPLTGIPNRRKLNEVMGNWTGNGRHFSLAVIDIDHFKLVNDTYGHQVGDETLKKLTVTVQSVSRKNDICFRYGGEEFVLLLPDTTVLEAYSIMEKHRMTIENTIRVAGKPITVSLGIAEFPLQATSPEELFRLADKALYQSKSEGRNRTTILS